MKKVLAMDDIVGELRDCAADSAEVGYKSRAQVAMLRAADDIVALQGRIVRQCQSVNELVAATEKCIEERDALRARVAELEERLDAMMPLFEEARDALPAITLGSAKLRGIRLDLADRMDDVGDPERWAARKSASAASADIDAARAAEAKK